jgi:cell division septum initiation protein DivIVA
MVGHADATKSMMLQDRKEGDEHLDLLKRELDEYQVVNASPDDMVAYGSRQIKRGEAIRLTHQAIIRTTKKVNELQKQLDAMPSEVALAQKELISFGPGG